MPDEQCYWNEMYEAALTERRATDATIEANKIRVAVAKLEHDVALDLTRPFMRLKPTLSRDGNMWCFLYGEDLQSGIAGFGETPERASRDFDKEWFGQSADKK
jgi:hypothetical protein